MKQDLQFAGSAKKDESFEIRGWMYGVLAGRSRLGRKSMYTIPFTARNTSLESFLSKMTIKRLSLPQEN
jgi:hypothetical protein